MTAGGVQSVMRWLFLGIDSLVYWAIEKIGEVFWLLARATVFTQEDLNNVTNRVYMLVALVMLFRLAFSFVNYIINPDQLTDSQKGGGKLVIKILTALVLLVATPTLFNEAYNLQSIIIEQDIIAKLVTGKTMDTDSSNSFSLNLSYNTFRSFYEINPSVYRKYCANSTTTADAGCVAAIDAIEPEKKIGSMLAQADQNKNIDLIAKTDFVTDKVTIDAMNNGLGISATEYVIDYKYGLSTITGLVIVYLLICFCFDVAIRMIKLAFLQLIAPIPIVMSLAPGNKKDTLSAWGKECFSTYLSLFLRLMVIYLAVFVIDLLIGTAGHKTLDVVTGETIVGWQGTFVNIFAIIGALLFAKEAPKLIEQILGLSGSGKITLNPLKPLREAATVPVVGGIAAGTAAAAGGLVSTAATGAIGLGRRVAAGWNTQKGQLIGSETNELMGAHLNATVGGFGNHFMGSMTGKGASKGVNALYNENKNNIMKEYKPMYTAEKSRRMGEKYYNQAEASKSAGGTASAIFDNQAVAAAFDQANAAKDMMNTLKSQYQVAADEFNRGVSTRTASEINDMRIAAGKAEGAYGDAKKELDAQLKMDPESAKIYEAYSSADARHSVDDRLRRFSAGTSTPPTPSSSSSSSGLSGGSSGPTSLRDTH